MNTEDEKIAAACDRIIDAEDLASMRMTLAKEAPALYQNLMDLRLDRRAQTMLTQRLSLRGASVDVIERIRLGILAIDDASLLPGYLEPHPKLAREKAECQLLLTSIARWAEGEGAEPPIWNDLTFEFLDSAGRVFGLAATLHEYEY